MALIDGLKSIKSGNSTANEYHSFITGVLEFIFYPHLISPTKEVNIHAGRKRIDITFDNAALTGIFHRLWNALEMNCQFVVIECKNYSGDPKNPEIDQLSGRFSHNRGRVGFLLCRTIDDMDKFLLRCIDTYKDNRGLIVPLQDTDIISILENHSELDGSFLERFLSERIRFIMTQ